MHRYIFKYRIFLFSKYATVNIEWSNSTKSKKLVKTRGETIQQLPKHNI